MTFNFARQMQACVYMRHTLPVSAPETICQMGFDNTQLSRGAHTDWPLRRAENVKAQIEVILWFQISMRKLYGRHFPIE